MTTSKYLMRVVGLGEFAQEFIDEGVLVFFARTAPEELLDYAVVHDRVDAPSDEVITGDSVVIDGVSFPILAVGPVANDNLSNLGHLVLKFNGLSEPEMPGDINVPRVPVPPVVHGSVIEIRGMRGT